MVKEIRVAFTSVSFDNFKALAVFRVSLNEMNVLVGGNNAGKSTVISAFRVLAGAIRTASTHRPQPHPGPGGRARPGWLLPRDQIPMSVENVDTDYNEEPSSVTFVLSNKNKLILWFPREGGCYLFTETAGKAVVTAAEFKREFPVSIGVVPVLGPVEHEESWVEKASLVRNLTTHRASRNFRNYWYHFPEDFPEFAALVGRTWPGMEIKPPERESTMALGLRMYCSEHRRDRELYWLGFGFQIWCQLLTHIVRNRNATILVLDEPETYLHPDVQRKLVAITRGAGPAILLATHSSEIIAEVEPDELLLMQRGQRFARRIAAAPEVQTVLDAIGSIQNPTLTRLARTRRVLFVEGDDFKLLARFARRIGLDELAEGSGLTVVPMGGFGNWAKVANVGWGISKTLGQPLLLGIVLDRDYRSDDDIEEIRRKLSQHLVFVHLHERKDIENYLLEPAVLQRAADRVAVSRGLGTVDVSAMLRSVCDSVRDDVSDQYIAKRSAQRQGGLDPATLQKRLRLQFGQDWASSSLALAPGKHVLSALNTRLQSAGGFALTHAKIVDACHLPEVPAELVRLLRGLESFRTQAVPLASNDEE